MTFSWIQEGHELAEDEHVKMSFDVKAATVNLKNTQLSHGGTVAFMYNFMFHVLH